MEQGSEIVDSGSGKADASTHDGFTAKPLKLQRIAETGMGRHPGTWLGIHGVLYFMGWFLIRFALLRDLYGFAVK